MMTQEEKQLFLKEFVKDERVINELFLYTKNKFIQKNDDYNLLDENYINTWEEYFQESKERGVFETLKKI
ncbi:hypothetical protein PG911_00540 [Tenacibaculum ovolyticum]|nr:hypothetical protein [Tenacibaculum ovolyticum]WBX76779.1 hypothetical protein PG911_00540 [Tenacibaculum ovolyticum]